MGESNRWNNYAISTADLATSLTKSSGSLVAANGTLEEAVALTATANTIIQDADVVGTALKTVAMRLRGTSTEEMEEEGLDTDGAVTSKSKLQSKIKGLSGVDILTDAGAYKSTYQILSEIADVWEDINDMDQAALLELLAGKRAGSVMSAILQNPDTLKDAFESANDASGSALEENEKYLDSIQGRIDLFNNAVQTMWSNTLDDDVVKGFVNLGTELIKIVDTIGLIPSILAAILMYKLAIGAAKAFHLGDLFTYIGMMWTAKDVTELQGWALSSLSVKQALLNSEVVKAAIARAGLTAAEAAGLTTTQLLTYGVKGLAAGFKNLWIAIGPVGWAILAVITALTAGIAIFNATNKTAEELGEELSDLKSEISDIKSEIDSLNTELETTRDRIGELEALPSLSFVEQEELNKLKQTNDELERRIKIQEAQLESQEAQKIQVAREYIGSVWNSEYADKAYYIDELGVIHKDVWNETGGNTKDILDESIAKYEENKNKVDAASKLLNYVSKYSGYEKYVLGKQLNNPYGTILSEDEFNQLESYEQEIQTYFDPNALKNIIANAEEDMIDITAGINMVLSDENFSDLQYGDDEEINTLLDELYGYQLRFKQAQGEYVKSDAISTMFDTTSTKEMQELGKEIQAIADDTILTDEEKTNQIKNKLMPAINSEADAYNRLDIAMESVGVTAQDIADYFVLETGAFDSSTIEGITKQYAEALTVMNKLKNMNDGSFTVSETSYNWDEFFTVNEDGEFEVQANKFSEILKGMDEDCRETFMSLATSVKNGELTWEQAMKSFEHSGNLAGLKVIEAQIIELNNVEFKNISDDISGVIDTFGELGSALEDVASSMELLNTAQTQMNNSGRISVKTALEIMQSTDQWNDILEIENGNIRLVGNATEILVENKLALIKSNLQNALSTVREQLATIDATNANVEHAETIEESTNLAVRELAGNMAYLTEMMKAYTMAAQGQVVDWNTIETNATNAKNAALEATNYKKNAAQKIGKAELEKREEELEAQLEMLEGIDTASEFKNNYDFDKTPGDKDNTTSDAFQKAMDYWENRIGANQAKYEQIQNEIDLLEKKGKIAGKEYYEEQINLEDQRLKLLEAQKAEAKKFLGTFAEGSDEWWEAANTLNDIEGEIDDVTSSIQDLRDAMAEVDWQIFEETHERFDNLIGQLDTIRELLSADEDTFFDDEGQWTEDGVAVLATYIQQLEMYKEALEMVNTELEAFKEPYAGNESYYAEMGIDSEQEYYDRLKQLTDEQYDYAKAVSDTEQSVVDMYESQVDAIEEYTNELVEAYNDYIDVVKEALDAERDLYEFKKDIKKQTKDIASLERRIASLSGSNNAADIAERRKLEAELYEAKEGLNDTYYDHAKDSQNQALDDEASAYEESMTNYIDMLRDKLKEAKRDMDSFIQQVTTAVTMNAGTVLIKYTETGIAIDTALTTPWENAAEAMKNYEIDSLALMNSWTQAGANGFVYNFSVNATDQLKSPWTAGSQAASDFRDSISSVMAQVVTNVKSNVATVTGELNKIKSVYAEINDSTVKAPSISTSGDNTGGNTGTPTTSKVDEKVKILQQMLNSIFFAGLDVDGIWGKKTESALRSAQLTMRSELNGNWIATDGKYTSGTRSALIAYFNHKIDEMKNGQYGNSSAIGQGVRLYTDWKNKLPVAFHAKGTLGTTHDELAITDESWIGEEITLAAGKNGQLQYIKKGSAVMPADISANLVEWGKLNPNMMDIGGAPNLNMISNAVNKPEFNLSFDALVKADRIDEGTLPEIKKYVTQEINSLVKQMNYAIKGYSR